MPSKNKNKSSKKTPFRLFHDALNFPFELKADPLWNTIIQDQQQTNNIVLNNPTGLCSKYGINEERAKKLLQSLDRYYKEKSVYDTVKTNRASWNMPCKDTNHSNCKVGKTIIKMMLPSYIIRRRLIEYGFISNQDTLCFDPGFCGEFTEFNDNLELIPKTIFCLSTASGIQSWGDLKSCVGVKQFDCKFIVEIYSGNQQRDSVSFWMKTCTDQTIIGNGQSTHCMTVSHHYNIKVSDDIVMRARTDNGILGVGYCNLIPPPRRKKSTKRKSIDGHSMLWIHENFDVELSFYCKSNCNATVHNIVVSLLSKNLEKNNKANPLKLFDYQQKQQSVAEYNAQQQSQSQIGSYSDYYLNDTAIHPQHVPQDMRVYGYQQNHRIGYDTHHYHQYGQAISDPRQQNRRGYDPHQGQPQYNDYDQQRYPNICPAPTTDAQYHHSGHPPLYNHEYTPDLTVIPPTYDNDMDFGFMDALSSIEDDVHVNWSTSCDLRENEEAKDEILARRTSDDDIASGGPSRRKRSSKEDNSSKSHSGIVQTDKKRKKLDDVVHNEDLIHHSKRRRLN